MDTGIYVALSKEAATFRDMEVTSNNIANLNTTAFQGEDLLFSDFLVPTTKQENNVAFTNDYATFRNTQQGSMQVTQQPLDAAIEGKGYFVVQTPLGYRYTRNGNFKTNQAGILTTSDGYPVMDNSNQVISFDDTDRVVQIRNDGTINVDNTDRATLNIVQFDNEQLLKHAGTSYYTADATPRPAQNITVVNGMLERSNVNPFSTMTHLMYVSRTASDTANFISTMYALERKASDTLAKVYS